MIGKEILRSLQAIASRPSVPPSELEEGPEASVLDDAGKVIRPTGRQPSVSASLKCVAVFIRIQANPSVIPN